MKGDWVDNWISEIDGKYVVYDEAYSELGTFASYDEACAALRGYADSLEQQQEDE